MKVVLLEFPDTQDISSIVLGSTVAIGSVSGGKVIHIGQHIDEASSQTLVPHTHVVPPNSGSVSIPLSSTGPAVP